MCRDVGMRKKEDGIDEVIEVALRGILGEGRNEMTTFFFYIALILAV